MTRSAQDVLRLSRSLFFASMGYYSRGSPSPFANSSSASLAYPQRPPALAIDFVYWTALFAPPMLVSLVVSTAFRATGDSTTPLLTCLGQCGIGNLFGPGLYLWLAWTHRTGPLRSGYRRRISATITLLFFY